MAVSTIHMIGTFGFFRLAEELKYRIRSFSAARSVSENGEKMRSGRQHRKLYKSFQIRILLKLMRKIAAEEGKVVEEAIMARFQMQQDLRKILSPEQYKKLHAHRRPPMPQ